jgi:hypothetical protein
VTSRNTSRKRARDAAAALAQHAYSIKVALSLSNDQLEREALARLGPVPAVCARCQQRPPRNFLMHGSGVWLCNECGGVK